ALVKRQPPAVSGNGETGCIAESRNLSWATAPMGGDAFEETAAARDTALIDDLQPIGGPKRVQRSEFVRGDLFRLSREPQLRRQIRDKNLGLVHLASSIGETSAVRRKPGLAGSPQVRVLAPHLTPFSGVGREKNNPRFIQDPRMRRGNEPPAGDTEFSEIFA